MTRDTYSYNDRGQLLTADGPGGASSYSYNVDGNMTLRKSKGGTANYGYDSAGRLDWVWDSITNNDIWYDFDAAGRPRQEQYVTKPEGATAYTVTGKRTYTYDDLGRLKADSVTSREGTTTVTSTTYGYDLDNNLTSKKTTGTAGAGENAYGYDYAGRLKSWTKDGTTTPYEWDAVGNRIKTGATTATFDARNRQMADGSEQFTYTARGTLASVTVDGGASRALTFDAFERKINDGATTYTYDSLDRVQSRGSTTFTYDGGSNGLANDGTTNYNRTPEGTLLSLATGTTKQWAVTDKHTDLTAGLTPDATQVAGSTAYDPFGTETATNGTTPAVGYQSGWTDPDNGHVNMAARWYQPGTGSFASRDTWQLDPSPSVQANRYTYGNATPINATDPTGHAVPIILGGLALGEAFGWGVLGTIVGGGGAVVYDTWSSSSSGTTTGTYSHSSALSSLGDGSLASSIYAQANNFAGGGSSGLVSTGIGACTYSCGSGIVIAKPQVVTPPRPPIDQNPNNGPHPNPAPTRPAPKPDWDPNNGKWNPGDAVNLVVGALKMLDLVNDQQYTPASQEAYGTAPGHGADSGARNRDDQDCRRNGEGWVEYGDLDSSHGDRATGVEACLDSAYLKTHPGSATKWKQVAPPGYEWARDYAGYLGNRPPGEWVNACHLLGKSLSGDGLKPENLSTCARSTNSNPIAANDPGIADHMASFESQVKTAIDQGQVVHYKVTPAYMGPRTVPAAYEITAQGTLNGKPGLSLEVPVSNMMYSNKFKNWYNIGTVIHEGVPVPTGTTP
ncbi:RHS repeat-associated core domain-containing protein [Streptomyces viridochromogenes]|uniref:Putative YD repeat protein n=1 Tax=Streptomyces viridochromogenes Tue57 TaxID=1160705 RepID=L8PHK7_STRVR|nr:RHS repeat-associated core domain-containing protein [Streptomyces viridochromogenes]ELS55654.1 putative YD repeat protein [Streptomyces viridochromogenes Tue57]